MDTWGTKESPRKIYPAYNYRGWSLLLTLAITATTDIGPGGCPLFCVLFYPSIFSLFISPTHPPLIYFNLRFLLLFIFLTTCIAHAHPFFSFFLPRCGPRAILCTQCFSFPSLVRETCTQSTRTHLHKNILSFFFSFFSF